MKSCFFVGHHDAGYDVLPLLKDAIARHIIEYGVDRFFVGHYGNFDKMAARAVIEAKKRHPQVTLHLLLPYHPYDRPIPTPNGFNGTYYPPGMEQVPKRYAITRANRHMIECSTHLIVYVQHLAGNSGNLVSYARRREEKGLIHIENLAR